VPHAFAQRGADGPGVAVVAVGRDPVRRDAGHRLGGAEERLGVTTLIQAPIRLADRYAKRGRDRPLSIRKDAVVFLRKQVRLNRQQKLARSSIPVERGVFQSDAVNVRAI
jgi:hypothetical protein